MAWRRSGARPFLKAVMTKTYAARMQHARRMGYCSVHNI